MYQIWDFFLVPCITFQTLRIPRFWSFCLLYSLRRIVKSFYYYYYLSFNYGSVCPSSSSEFCCTLGVCFSSPDKITNLFSEEIYKGQKLEFDVVQKVKATS